jgi:alpha-galactosidase
MKRAYLLCCGTWFFVVFCCGAFAAAAQPGQILTPAAPARPRINGPTVFGVRPGSPVLYTIPAAGQRPIEFSVDGLPDGATVDAATGQIRGTIKAAGVYKLVLRARNAQGSAQKAFRVIVGENICLTPPLGWNSWNCWAEAVDQNKVLRSARAMVKSGLLDHGWTYVNIDDTWQGPRGGSFNGIQPNKKFPDMKGLCDDIHAMGLKPGIYSTPWITSYAKYTGGSSDNRNGAWNQQQASDKYWRHGKHAFAANDARQWAAWGFDYLKYDWSPNDVPHVEEMSKALRQSGRDIVYSLSNSAPFAEAAAWARLANCWRTTGDIWDYWEHSDNDWRYAVSEIAFTQDRWAPYAGPGHWNDPDMLVVGYVGWGPSLHSTKLSPDEQYSHISMWCLLSAPLLIGCDMDRLDPFTLNLLTNDEVLALVQDSLGMQAKHVAAVGSLDVFLKELEDGSKALGFFNRGDKVRTFTFNKLSRVGITKPQHVRDLWQQKDLPDANGKVDVTVNPHGVVILKFTMAGRP